MSGIHHVTAISGKATRNFDFNTRVLGLPCVKQTVNFDDPGMYHLCYGERDNYEIYFVAHPRDRNGTLRCLLRCNTVWRQCAASGQFQPIGAEPGMSAIYPIATKMQNR